MSAPHSIKIPAAKTLGFKKTVYSYFKLHGRDLPWRGDPSPYDVFISEVMLQQTQVDRVIPFYCAFTATLPDFGALASAPLQTVLRLWQGLGYNRRAMHLKRAAEQIVRDHGGVLPSSPEILETLPGIGKATAASIAAFAFNVPTVFLETNIRTVLIHHFFSDSNAIADEVLLTIAASVLDKKHPAQWYSAMMDYGTMLKKEHGNLSRRSKQYKKQSKFEGSRRQMRGKVLKLLLDRERLSSASLARLLKTDGTALAGILDEMTKEHIITRRRGCFSISGG